jgi:SAM-dependent methyltransferase
MTALNIKEPFPHDVMPLANHDEHSRENIIAAMKHHLTEHVYPKDELVYENQAKPAFIKANNREPKDCGEVHHLMMKQPYTRMWSSIARTIQEMLWDNQSEIVEHNKPRLTKAAEKLAANPKGSLTLDPDCDMPRYVSAVDIHAMPGGYSTSRSETDLATPAIYDRGAYYYTRGMAGRWGQGGGTANVTAFKKFFPDLKPKRILDLGCAIGWTTLPIVDEWPDAEVHALDLGESFMRYAHARAEALGKTVHYHQMSGENLKFPDGHFDLVFSGGLFHETSNKAAKVIMKEIHRVLKSGGVSFNFDIPYGGDYKLHAQFMLNWDCYFNAEPFWREWTSWDRREFMSWGGFDKDTVIDTWAARDHEGNFRFFEKPFDELHTSARGGIGRVQFFGAQK